MRKRLIAIVIILILSIAAAYADHSVLPAPGDLDETQALDRAVALLCDERGLNEEDVRGRWYYLAVYYTDRWTEDQGLIDESYWYIVLDPGPEDGTATVAGLRVRYEIRASDGALLERVEGTSRGVERWPLVPTAEQMQPAEAIRTAQSLLAQCLGSEETAANWRDYVLSAVTDESGRFWYQILLDYTRTVDRSSPFSWNVWLDANTGEIVWQTDAARFAGRYAISREYGSWLSWYNDQLAAKQTEWGPLREWDWHQYAAFEEACFGTAYYPERRYSLPDERDISFEEARDAAIAWVAEDAEFPSSAIVTGSAFWDDANGWIDEMMSDGIPPENNRFWEIIFTVEGERTVCFSVIVDPATGEVIGAMAG